MARLCQRSTCCLPGAVAWPPGKQQVERGQSPAMQRCDRSEQSRPQVAGGEPAARTCAGRAGYGRAAAGCAAGD
jgi:hypothetical protein